MKRFFAIITCLALSLNALAIGWNYQTINVPDGVAHNFTCCFVEKRGYAWGGTKHGLYRFSYNQVFKWYYADGENGSIPGNHIYNIDSDISGNLWVFTNNGVGRYDRYKDVFVPVYIQGVKGLEKVIAYSVLETKDGDVYLGGDSVVYKYDPSSNRATVAVEIDNVIRFKVENIYERGDNSLRLFSPNEGIYRFYPDEGKITLPATKMLDSYAHYMDNHGRFWNSRYNRGVELYDSDGALICTYTTENSDISSNLVTCFLERDGDIYIGTEGKGINILDPQTGKFSLLNRDDSIFNSFPCSYVTSMHLDAGNTIWASTEDADMILLKEAYMRSFAVSPIYDVTGRTSDKVLSITGQGGDNMFVGTANSGVFRLSPDHNYNVPFEHIESTGSECVEAMVTLPDGRVLMSYKKKGLYLLDPNTKKVTPFNGIKNKKFQEDILYSTKDISLAFDQDSHVIIFSDDAYLWNIKTNEVILYELTPLNNSICPVSNGKGLYYFCDTYIYSWDTKALTHRIIFDFNENAYINAVSRDLSGNFWVATDKGIYMANTSTNSIEKKEVPGIDYAETIIADSYNRVWIGTQKGMFLYLPENGIVRRFTEYDGVSWNRYNGSAIYVTPNHILFGGSNGILAIDPSIALASFDEPEIEVEGVYLNGKRIENTNKKFFVPAYFKSLTMNFNVLEDNILRTKQFRYYITNPKDSREIISEEPSLSFSALGSGKYTVKVSCSQNNGEWTEPRELLVFKVNPFWYESILFWLVLIVALFLGAYYVFSNLHKQSEYKVALARSEAEFKAGQDNIKFLLNVSHELKTPLTLIISPLARMLKNKGKADPDYRVLSNIYRQANRMSSLILTVLNAHKIQEGSATLCATEQNINSWIETIAETFDEEAESRGMKIARSYDKDIDLVAIDAQKLENVLTNMLINAFKHSPDDTTITVGTKADEDNRTIRVFVSDQGEGLGGVNMTKLFSRYYQGYAQQTGSGLGLAYANSIVELHKGRMGAYENPEGGSTFYFDIPGTVKKPLIEEIAAERKIRKASGKKIEDAVVLFVDDDADLREYIASVIAGRCKDVHVAADGKQALDFLKENQVDIVVTDVMMPVMDGLELCANIKKDPDLGDLPVIMLTAKISERDREFGLSIGADDYLPKPFEEEELFKSITKLI